VRRRFREQWREVHRVLGGHTPTHAHLRSRLLFMAVVTFWLDVAASLLIFFFERGADRTDITSPGDAFFWTTTQLLTVSSQLKNPISTPARILDIGLQAWAISVVAILAGSFASFFHRRSNEMDPPSAR
jgi:hypothetical protein